MFTQVQKPDIEKLKRELENKLEEVSKLAFSSTVGEREKYDESLKTYRDRLAELAFAQQEGMEKGIAKGMAKGIAKGRAEGLAEGMEKGLAKGMEEGLAEGRAEEKLKNARNMKAAGISPELIAQITGLTPEAIAEL